MNQKSPKAEIAVSTSRLIKTGSSCSIDPNSNGGIIFAENSRFYNNYRDVEFMQFLFENVSQFHKTTFEVDDGLIRGPSSVPSRVSMWDVHEVFFEGCTMVNNMAPTVTGGLEHSVNDRGIGIGSIDSRFLFFPECLSKPLTDCDSIVSGASIEGFYYGMELKQTNAAQRAFLPLMVKNIDFRNNSRGFYGQGLHNFLLLDNTFINDTATFWSYNSTNGRYENYGCYLNGCMDYEVQGNNFDNNDTSSGWPSFGLLVHNQSEFAQEIKNNEFDGFVVAAGPIGINGASRLGEDRGLEFKCNDYNSSTYDMYLNADTTNVLSTSTVVQSTGSIRLNQGRCRVEAKDAANNEFVSSTTCTQYTKLNLETGISANIAPYIYNYPKGQIYWNPCTYGNPNITKIGCEVRLEDMFCPFDTAAGHLIGPSPISPSTSILDLKAQLEVVSEVIFPSDLVVFRHGMDTATSTSFPEKLNDLVDVKDENYIHPSIMGALLEHPEAGNHLEDIQDILLAQFPWTIPIEHYLYTQTLFDSAEVDDMIANATADSARLDSIISFDLATDELERLIGSRLTYQLANEDSLTLEKIIDSLENESDYASRVRLVPYLILAADSSRMDSVLNEIPDYFDHELGDWKAYQEWYADWFFQGNSILDLDTNDLDFLDSIVIRQGMASMHALTLMQLIDTSIDYQEPTPNLPETYSSKQGTRAQEQMVFDSESGVLIYPNPSNDLLNVRVQEFNADATYMITLYDITGRKLMNKSMRSAIEQLTISHLRNGTYLVKIEKNSRILLSELLIKN